MGDDADDFDDLFLVDAVDTSIKRVVFFGLAVLKSSLVERAENFRLLPDTAALPIEVASSESTFTCEPPPPLLTLLELSSVSSMS